MGSLGVGGELQHSCSVHCSMGAKRWKTGAATKSDETTSAAKAAAKASKKKKGGLGIIKCSGSKKYERVAMVAGAFIHAAVISGGISALAYTTGWEAPAYMTFFGIALVPLAVVAMKWCGGGPCWLMLWLSNNTYEAILDNTNLIQI